MFVDLIFISGLNYEMKEILDFPCYFSILCLYLALLFSVLLEKIFSGQDIIYWNSFVRNLGKKFRVHFE